MRATIKLYHEIELYGQFWNQSEYPSTPKDNINGCLNSMLVYKIFLAPLTYDCLIDWSSLSG